MKKRIIIAGSGFAGTWSALSAARAVAQARKEVDVEIVVVSPTPSLHIRPRLYEPVLEGMDPDVGKLFAVVGVQHRPGTVETIHADWRQIEIVLPDGTRNKLPYDKFVLATGSRLFQPPVPGLREHSFNVDQLSSALALDQHLKSLPAPIVDARRRWAQTSAETVARRVEERYLAMMERFASATADMVACFARSAACSY